MRIGRCSNAFEFINLGVFMAGMHGAYEEVRDIEIGMMHFSHN